MQLGCPLVMFFSIALLRNVEFMSFEFFCNFIKTVLKLERPRPAHANLPWNESQQKSDCVHIKKIIN